MHRAALLLLTGCGSTNLTGSWSGECDFADYEMAIGVELTQSEELLEGSATAGFSWQGYDFDYSGTATGSVVEDVVLLELDLGEDGLISLDFTTPAPGRMEGACSGDGGIYGGGWLER